MSHYVIYSAPALLLLITVMFWTLVPGGPVETRRFSHYPPFILGSFNTFLTILGIGSLVVVYFCFAGSKWAFFGAAICGASYFSVYALDLGKVFPVSPDNMSRTLFIIEVTGLLLSIPLTLLALLSASVVKNVTRDFHISVAGIVLLCLMVLLGTGIVIFATKVTMRK